MNRKRTDLDRLYGLEPVFEPGQLSGSAALEQFVAVDCPYCAETLEIRADLSAGSQSYVEDCQVCCQPILLTLQVADDGGLAGLNAERIDR